MKKLAALLICLTLLFSLSGCLSGKFRVEPKEDVDNNTLVMAHVKLIAYGFDGPFGHNGDIITGLDGEYKNSLIVYLRNLEQNQVLQVTAKVTKRDFGLVFFDRIPAGKYHLISINYKKEVTAGNYIYTYNLGDRSNMLFDIEKGKVNNLGEVVIHYYKEMERSRFHGKSTVNSNAVYDVNKNYLNVENWFRETYPESLWNEFDWINVELAEITNVEVSNNEEE